MNDYLESTPDLEGLNPVDEGLGQRAITPTEADYLQEAVEYGDPEIIAMRADELGDKVPPTGIDANPQVAAILEPVRDTIDPQYLEAPTDVEQIQEISTTMQGIEGTYFKDWEGMNPQERLDTLQNIENTAAEISHRGACPVVVEQMEPGHFGYFSPNTGTITVNSLYLESNDPADHKECLDTILHEGRHAYQDYNLNIREVHTADYEVRDWKDNLEGYGYQDVQTCGFEAYANQPVEADARDFAADVLSQLENA